jgi:hypothetical protein
MPLDFVWAAAAPVQPAVLQLKGMYVLSLLPDMAPSGSAG